MTTTKTPGWGLRGAPAPSPCHDSHRTTNPMPSPQSPPPRIIRRPATDDEPARFVAAWSPEAPATPRERLAAARARINRRRSILLASGVTVARA